MKPQRPHRRRSTPLAHRARALLCAFAATLVALPASAGITVPTEPIQTGGRIPPNILFILDDSGSMADDFMPDNVPGTSTVNVASLAYTRNTIHYNPANTYQPWMAESGNGSLMTGGTDYANAYSSTTNASGSVNLYDTVRTFYVPIDLTNSTAAYLGNGANYYRYQILTDGRIIRSQWLLRSGTGPNYNNGPALNSGCTNTGTGSTWRNCTQVTPSYINALGQTVNRTEAAERTNYATWYSYHRTRMKVAKAGAGAAFSEIGNNLRVGFRTIWERNLTGNAITFNKPLLISRNSGLFIDSGADNNRTVWYQRLYGTTASGTTPLRDALNEAGRYFQNDTTNTGPWGPEAGVNQLSCRQNFSLLTTDGYRNDSGYTNAVGEQDNLAGSTITGVVSGQTYTYTPSRPYSSAYSDTLADVAMRYWKNDLRTDLPNNVRTSSANPAFWQHMVTFAISIGAAGTLNPEADLPALTSGGLSWPNPSANLTPETIDDLWHASVNGRGSFVLANDPNEFTAALRRTLSSILERTGSFSNLAANSTRLDSGTRSYQASFVSGLWTGNVRAFPVTASGIDTATPLWNASAGIPTTGRRIYTNGLTGGAVFPTAAQQTLLARATSPTVSGANNAAYIAGNRSLELANGGTLRNRSQLLGDIINSSPAYAAREQTIYVGANDGMMHAININDGTERFAYVPGGINFADLSTLSHPDYEHRYFVDGAIALSTRAQTPASTILVGALGRGGKGIYTLDVTSPQTFDQTKVMWERTETTGANMGLVVGQPIITKLNNGETGVIVPNGINSAGDRAALLIYRLSDGALLAEINTGVGNATTPNGLMAATVRDNDGNGTADYVYAGDMLGNVWRFNLTSASSTTWTTAANRVVLYTAINDAGQRQPVTAAPAVVRDPATFQLWIFFGTGRFITEGDLSNLQVQSIYGIKDSATTVTGRGALQRRTIVATENGARAFEAPSNIAVGVQGWYMDLVNPPYPPGTAIGERVVSDTQVVAGVLIFSSIIPSQDPCLPGGSGYLNALNAFSGASLPVSLFDLDGDADFNDERITTGPNTGVAIGSVPLGGMGTLGAIFGGGGGTGQICLNISDASIECERIRETRQVGRVSWREIIRN
ncbi:pilus assembly protein [Pseudoxanthomonas mexicana]